MQPAQPIDRSILFAPWSPVRFPESVYVHIPFCRHRCGYCNFSLVANRDYLIERFLRAVEIEIGWLSRTYPLRTLFLGGGTPSHLSSAQLIELKRILETRFEFSAATEVTAECNPNDLDESKAATLAEIGINRVSLGVQSLNPEKLKRLERDHFVEDVVKAVFNSRKFARSVSLDLIFAAPCETLRDWESDLDAALQLNPDHLSTYELTFEKGTQFWNRLLHQSMSEADEDLRAEMYELTIAKLHSCGLDQYEVSSFAKPGHRCHHNEIYWKGDPYFAFGPGASRFIDGCRQTNHQSTLNYLKQIERGEPPIATSEKLTPRESAKELLAIGLRRVDGIVEEKFIERTGFTIVELLGAKGDLWIGQGLIERRSGVWRLSQHGRLVCDWVATKIISAN